MEKDTKYYSANGKRFKLYIDEEQIKETVSILANKINAGNIIKPPPMPSKPVRRPTIIPVKINLILK